jgi:CRP/FNR family nitrogen fixation transcriptional regulator
MTLAYDSRHDPASFRPAGGCNAPRADAPRSEIGALLAQLGVRIHYDKDEEIFAQDEDVDRVHWLVSGVVRTTRLLSDGRRHVAAFYYPGELIGIEAGATHRFSAEAICPAEVLVVRRSALRTSAGDGRLERAIWDATRRELERTQDHLVVLGRKSACERVASFLMDLAQRHPSDTVTLPMGRQDIADYLGLTIETVSRMLTELQSRSVVEFQGLRRFTVKRWQALEDIAA